ncbi:MAG: hypothetical protein V1711_00995 [bacterium]
MNRFFFILCISFLLPANALAASVPASFSAARSLITASSSPGNSYLAGISVVITAPIGGDLSAIGGGIVSTAPVAGDEFLIAGSIQSRASVAGDFRAAGWSISIEKPIAGDLIAFGLSVHDSGRANGNVFIIALNTTLDNGASGPVTIYGNNVSLSGDFSNNVDIVASGRVTIAPDTIIRGTLSYEAPEMATIPESATIVGGVEYTNISYLPDAGTSRALAFVSVGFFLFVRILGALILAGLLTGLFPRLAETVVKYIYTERVRSILLTLLLGFALLVATPILFAILILTFVGIGIALLVLIAYILIVFLSILYAGILLGGIFARRFARRETVLWHDGVLGMLALSLISLIPFVGLFIVILLTTFSTGTLLLIFFNFAFPRDKQIFDLL